MKTPSEKRLNEARGYLSNFTHWRVLEEYESARDFVARFERIEKTPRQTARGIRKGLSRDERAALNFARAICHVIENE